MNIEALKLYCDIVRLNSFSRAAVENDVSQSMSSQTVQALESHLGVTLIDRTQRPWKVTAEGTAFYDGALDIVTRYAELERRILDRRDSMRSTIRVASIYSAGLRHLNSYIHRFAQLAPWAKISIEYLHPEQVYDRVSENLVDLGIISFPRQQREIEITPWQNEEMVAVCPPDHPFAALGSLPPEKMDGQPFIAFDPALDIRKEIDRYLKENGAVPDIVLEFDNIEVIKQAVEIGSGVALLPRPSLDKEIRLDTLRAVPLKGERFVRPLSIIRNRGRVPSDTLTKFITHLQNNQHSR